MRRSETGTPSRLVGRPEERLRVEEFAARLATAPRSMVLVGEPGIGKTSLWVHGLDRAAAAGHTVLTARPAEDDWPVPGLGLRDLFGAGSRHGRRPRGAARRRSE